jgi:C1A family cysteine protease
MQYKKLQKDKNQLIQALVKGYPFMFTFTVYDSFESSNTITGGVITIPEMTERLIGGIVGICVGYDDDKDRWIIRYFKGIEWGDKGYLYMPSTFMFGAPYQTPELSAFTTDFWIIEIN